MAKINQKFNALVYRLICQIPRGRVATYGQISNELRIMNHELRISPKMVGWALSANRDPKVPCHRVVDRNGRLAPNFAFGGWQEQRRRLISEGVKFKDEMHVDLEKCSWEK